MKPGASLVLLAWLIPSAAMAEAEGIPYRHGVTFEANIGVGFRSSVRCATESNGETCEGLGGSRWGLALNGGVGAWLRPNLALTGRIAGVTVLSHYASPYGPGTNVVDTVVIGPHLQFWPTSSAWIGFGIGWATIFDSNQPLTDTLQNSVGIGLDLRVGYTFASRSGNTANVSLEATPASFLGGLTGPPGSLAMAILLGYQYE